MDSKLKVKVALGEGDNLTIKRLTKVPASYQELTNMVYHRLRERLHHQEKDERLWFYYKDMTNGMIGISDNVEWNLALEYWDLYSLKSIKIYVYDYSLERTIERSKIIFESVEGEEDNEHESELSDPDEHEEPSYEADKDQYIKNSKEKLDEYHREDQRYLDQYENHKSSDDSSSLDASNVLRLGISSTSKNEEKSEDRQDYQDEEPGFLNFVGEESDEELDQKEKIQQKEESDDKFDQSSIALSPEVSYDMASESWIQQIKDANSIQKISDHLKFEVYEPNDDEEEGKIKNEEERRKLFEYLEKRKEKIIVNNIEFENNAFDNQDDDEHKEPDYIQEEMEKVKLDDPNYKSVRKVIHSVFEPVFALKIQKFAGNELPNEKGFSFISGLLKRSIIGLSEEDADQLMRIDETQEEFSNQDVVVWKPNSLLKKTWRMKNLGTRTWPADTRIVSVSDNLYFQAPMINNFLKPGEMMDLSIKIYIPKEVPGDNNICEYILRLYCEEFKWFGEPIIATWHVDTPLYKQVMSQRDNIDYKIPRVTDDKKIVENYEIAKELSERKKEPFSKALNSLQKADLNRR